MNVEILHSLENEIATRENQMLRLENRTFLGWIMETPLLIWNCRLHFEISDACKLQICAYKSCFEMKQHLFVLLKMILLNNFSICCIKLLIIRKKQIRNAEL